MDELNREIKNLRVICYNQPLALEVINILEIVAKDSIQNAKKRAKIVDAWKRVSDEQDEKIEKLKKLVIKQTQTAARLDPRRKVEYWQRLNDAGFYDGYSESTVKYVREIYRLCEQQNTAD